MKKKIIYFSLVSIILFFTVSCNAQTKYSTIEPYDIDKKLPQNLANMLSGEFNLFEILPTESVQEINLNCYEYKDGTWERIGLVSTAKQKENNFLGIRVDSNEQYIELNLNQSKNTIDLLNYFTGKENIHSTKLPEKKDFTNEISFMSIHDGTTTFPLETFDKNKRNENIMKAIVFTVSVQ